MLAETGTVPQALSPGFGLRAGTCTGPTGAACGPGVTPHVASPKDFDQENKVAPEISAASLCGGKATIQIR